MKKFVLAASLVSLFAATLPVHAQTEPPKSPPSAKSQRDSLLTPQERDQFREKARSAKTPEERTEIRKQMRSTMEQRAKEKGIAMPHGPAGRPGTDKEGRRPELLTPEERTQMREKMRAAKTPEERAAARKQMRELTEQRAKEKGITLPHRRGPAESPKAPVETPKAPAAKN